MEEPMDESSPAAVINSQLAQEDNKAKLSILRPGSMVMMTITNEDYESEYWPKLESAIHQLLTRMPGAYIPISYEQIYSCVYKCVCKQFSERLYNDLMNYMTAHLEKTCRELQDAANAGVDPGSYIEKFDYAMKQYLTALDGIVPVFNYMILYYDQTEDRLDVELKSLFVALIADKHVPTLIPLLVEASSKAFTVSPPVMSSVITKLYTLKPEFAQLRPQLFARYIPSVLPPCSESELPHYIEETKQMQRDLMTHPEYISGDQTRKRPTEEDAHRTTSMNYPRNSKSNSPPSIS